MGLYVPVALIDNLGFVNALKRLRERLGLKGGTGAELFKEAVERLAEWEGAVAQAGKGVLVEAVPVKRSKWHEGFYFNDDWRRVRAALPLGEGGEDPSSWWGTVVLKTGEAYRARAVGGGGYANFSLPPPPKG
jgi:N-methylhydantoinase B/oxoprolinase/acetone carboxylase alpha subunit